MPSTLQRKPARPRSTRGKPAPSGRSRTARIKPIPMHPAGSLPVTKFELEFEQLAGPDVKPNFVR